MPSKTPTHTNTTIISANNQFNTTPPQLRCTQHTNRTISQLLWETTSFSDIAAGRSQKRWKTLQPLLEDRCGLEAQGQELHEQ